MSKYCNSYDTFNWSRSLLDNRIFTQPCRGQKVMSLEDRIKLKEIDIADIQVNKNHIEIVAEKELKNENGTCGLSEDGVTNLCGSNKKLAPIMDPRFNLREVVKQLLLLEDHVYHEDRTCKDCVYKHLNLIDAFIEECITLDKKKEYIQECEEFSKKFRVIFKELTNGTLDRNKCLDAAQKIRILRKPLLQKYGTFLG